MQSYTLARTGKEPIRFTGTMLAAVDNKTDRKGKERSRYTTITIYHTDKGRYVVHIEYTSNWKTEAGHSQADAVDDPKLIPAILTDFDVLDYVEGYPVGERFQERQRRLLKAIDTSYKEMVGKILAADGVAHLLAEEA